jgi:peptidoglycan/LPS O-acetylase OafA/YrhL
MLAMAAIATQLIQFGVLDGVMARLGFGPGEPKMLRESTFFPIILGVLLAHTLHNPTGYSWGLRFLSSRWVAPLLLLMVLVVLAIAPTDIRGWARPTIHITLFLFLAACVVREDHGLSWLLRWGPLQRIGVISYGLYLLHLFGLHGALLVRTKLPILDSEWIVFPLTFMFSIMIAEASFRFYETPFLRLKSRFDRQSASPSTNGSSTT